ncbi:DsrE family protein [Rhodoferax antarcticus]|uniref:DsrE family protein n=1 Tax=Rhodoferax antarcticus TaxID=81479 RepID=UPI002224404B|nr:hypothetical protein [Rhodoferax antarcticus]MCW2313227.1 ABC-type transporter MlaC component [Rhodoferax antarcticus]
MPFRSMMAAAILMAGMTLAQAQDKVVYHVNDTASQALAALRNIRNHLDTDPSAQITLVAHAFGIDFLMEGISSVPTFFRGERADLTRNPTRDFSMVA